MNEAIADDESLGDGFCIGHSYFCGLEPGEATEAKLSAIVEYELVPMPQHFSKKAIHSGNLYQIFTYVKNKEEELALSRAA